MQLLDDDASTKMWCAQVVFRWYLKKDYSNRRAGFDGVRIGGNLDVAVGVRHRRVSPTGTRAGGRSRCGPCRTDGDRSPRDPAGEWHRGDARFPGDPGTENTSKNAFDRHDVGLPGMPKNSAVRCGERRGLSGFTAMRETGYFLRAIHREDPSRPRNCRRKHDQVVGERRPARSVAGSIAAMPARWPAAMAARRGSVTGCVVMAWRQRIRRHSFIPS